MTFTPPTVDDLIATQVALAQGSLEVFVDGVRGQPDLTEGSDELTQIEQQALLWDFFNRKLAQFYIDFDYTQTSGIFLDMILAVRGLQRIQPGFAVVPVFCAGDPAVTFTVRAGYRFMAADSTGALSIAFDALQSLLLPTGQAGVKPIGASGVWVLAIAEVAGASSNVGPGAIGGVGSEVIAGLLTASNPPVQSTAAPTWAVTGSGSGTAQYAVVARGQQGRALMSAVATVTGLPAVLDAGNYAALSVQPVENAAGYDWVKLVGIEWLLLGQTDATILAIQDTGQTPAAYTLPTTNDANAAAGGTNGEDDLTFKARADQLQEVTGSGTDDALIRAALAVANVTQAFVQDGEVAGTATLSYVATINPLPSVLAQQVGTKVDDAAAAGAMVTVQQITPVPVQVSYTYVATSNPPGNLIELLNAAITAAFLTLSPGATLHDSVLSAAMQAVSGVDHIPTRIYSVTGGSTYTNSDIPGQNGVLFGRGQIVVTVGG